MERLICQLDGMRAIPHFGASDCRCGGHLLSFADPTAWQGAGLPHEIAPVSHDRRAGMRSFILRRTIRGQQYQAQEFSIAEGNIERS